MGATKSKTSKFFMTILLTLLLLTAIGRILSVLYSMMASDIMYMTSVWVYILEYAVTFIFLIIKTLGYAAVIWAFMFAEKIKCVKFTALILAISLLDSAASFIIDVIQHSISGYETVAAAALGLNFLYILAMIAAISAISSFISKKYKYRNNIESIISLSNPPQTAIFYSSLLILASKIIAELIYTIEFLFDVNFVLYDGELTAIISSYAKILMVDGILTFILITCLYMFINRIVKVWFMNNIVI